MCGTLILSVLHALSEPPAHLADCLNSRSVQPPALVTVVSIKLSFLVGLKTLST